jgi:nicotinate-nucleotide adenylyltransferase
MIQRAIKGIPYFKLLLTEFEREGPSYTYDTMKQLQAHNPQVSFFFIIGADMMHYLPKWVKIKELMQMVTFIGVRRPGWHISTNHDPYTKQVQLIDMLISPLSSTEIRERKRKGKSIRFLVPEPVYQYIEERQLYES